MIHVRRITAFAAKAEKAKTTKRKIGGTENAFFHGPI